MVEEQDRENITEQELEEQDRENITEQELEEHLEELLSVVSNMEVEERDEADLPEAEPFEDVRVSTFADALVLTHDRGVTLTFPDGTRFALTIQPMSSTY